MSQSNPVSTNLTAALHHALPGQIPTARKLYPPQPNLISPPPRYSCAQLMGSLVDAAERLRQFSPVKEQLSAAVLEEVRFRLYRIVSNPCRCCTCGPGMHSCYLQCLKQRMLRCALAFALFNTHPRSSPSTNKCDCTHIPHANRGCWVKWGPHVVALDLVLIREAAEHLHLTA
jgi:hypothetical protein